jgi:hypothetical protein
VELERWNCYLAFNHVNAGPLILLSGFELTLCFHILYVDNTQTLNFKEMHNTFIRSFCKTHSYVRCETLESHVSIGYGAQVAYEATSKI